MENNGHRVTIEDVIAKLKDYGDFNSLRLKIVRKLKDNEDLREHISTVVKQSAALHRAGAENMKPRQLSDAIYEEVREKVMSQISDNIWKIIRSKDGMKGEIEDTVQSVYNKLVSLKEKDEVEPSFSDMKPNQKQGETASAADIDVALCGNGPAEPPSFPRLHNHLNNNHEGHHKGTPEIPTVHRKGSKAEQRGESHMSQDTLHIDDLSGNAPSGFSANLNHNPPADSGDEDPDVPPGFG